MSSESYGLNFKFIKQILMVISCKFCRWMPQDITDYASLGVVRYTVRCLYNVVNFLTNIYKGHPTARPFGWGVGWILWIQHLIYCPACRTTLIATRFRVAVICPIIQVPHCIRVFFYFVWFVFINHSFQFYYELCTYCNILDIYLS